MMKIGPFSTRDIIVYDSANYTIVGGVEASSLFGVLVGDDDLPRWGSPVVLLPWPLADSAVPAEVKS